MISLEYYCAIFTFCIAIRLHQQSSDDDMIDRVNRAYTVWGLIVLAVISDLYFMTSHVSSLISCWNRANFRTAYIKFTNHLCFMTQTYTLHPNQTLSEFDEHR